MSESESSQQNSTDPRASSSLAGESLLENNTDVGRPYNRGGTTQRVPQGKLVESKEEIHHLKRHMMSQDKEFRQQFVELEDDVEMVQSDIGRAQKDIENIHDDISSIYSTQEEMARSLSELDERVSRNEEDIEGVDDLAEEMNSRLDNLSSSVDELYSGVETVQDRLVKTRESVISAVAKPLLQAVGISFAALTAVLAFFSSWFWISTAFGLVLTLAFYIYQK